MSSAVLRPRARAVRVLARSARVVTLAALLLARPATAQQDAPPEADVDQKVSYFLDRSYLFYEVPQRPLAPIDKTILFEAQIAPNFFLYQNATPQFAKIFERPRWVHAVSVAITPMVRARQTTSWSDPLRTPSYMPKGTVQLFFLRQIAPDTSLRHRAWVLIGQGVIGHHSNGQEGCLYEGYTAQPVGNDKVCMADAGTDTVHKIINRRNGSFSTNYLQAGIYGTKVQADYNNEFKSSRGGGLLLEVNPTWFGIDKDVAPLYGRTRLRATFEMIDSMPHLFGWRPGGRGRVEADLERIFGAAPSVDDYKLILEADWAIPQSARWFGGLGLFARWYRGQDYYNLGFLTNISVLQVGILASNERFGAFPFPRNTPR